MKLQWSVLVKHKDGTFRMWISHLDSKKDAKKNIKNSFNLQRGKNKEFFILAEWPWEYKN